MSDNELSSSSHESQTESLLEKTSSAIASEKRKETLISSLILFSLTGASIIGGFGLSLARLRKEDPTSFQQGSTPGGGAAVGEGLVPGALSQEALLADDGTKLAIRALKRATFYAVGGFSLFCFLGWKLSGAKDLQDFRIRAGNILPRIPKNNPPQSRTEFSGLNDLLQYVIDEDEKKKKQETQEQ